MTYLIKGSHVYQSAFSDLPMVIYVTGPDGTSDTFRPNDLDYANVVPMPSGIAGTEPPATSNGAAPEIVQIAVYGSYTLNSYAGVGFQNEEVGTIQVSVNGEADPNPGDFHAEINWGDSASWDPGQITYQGSSGTASTFIITGSHVYQKPGTNIPIVVYVTGPDGTSTDFPTNDLDYANVSPNPNGMSLGNLTPAQWNLNEPGYDGTIPVSGGSGGYKDLEVSGLPTGLSATIVTTNVNDQQSGTITIEGTPTKSGTFTLGVSLEDGDGDSLTGTESLTINAAPITIGNLTPAEWNVNEPGYDGTIPVSGGTGGYTNLMVTGLPTGLSAELSGSTITISGKPTQSGTFTLSTSLQDGNGDTGSGTESLTINVPAISLGSLSPTQWEVKAPGYDGTIAITGGSGSYTNLVVTGLPAGLNPELSGSTITISGTPTQSGVFTLNVSVEDGSGSIAAVAASLIRSAQETPDDGTGGASATYKLTITNGPTLGQLSPLTTVNAKARYTMQVSGGTAPYQLSSITGLPKGLTASLKGSTITITGKPLTLGSFNCVVNLTDKGGATPRNPSFVLTINATTIGQSDGVQQGNGAANNLADNEALGAAIAKAASATVSEATLRTIVSIESTANSNIGLQNPGYAGPFQVSTNAAKQVGYKLTLAKLNVLKTNVTVAAKYLAWCATQLDNMGFPVTTLNLYLCYQQGPGGVKALLDDVADGSASTTPATSNELNNSGNLKTYITPNSSITEQDFYNYWAAKVTAENDIVNGAN